MADKHQAHLRLAARLRETAADVERLTGGLDEDGLARRVEPGKWSLKELVCHLLRVQQVFEGRIDAMLAAEGAALMPYEPDGDAEFDRLAARPASEARNAFLDARAKFLTRLEKLSPEQWHRSGRHPEYPHYDVHFAVEYLLHHEGHHLYQIYQRRVLLGKIPH